MARSIPIEMTFAEYAESLEGLKLVSHKLQQGMNDPSTSSESRETLARRLERIGDLIARLQSNMTRV